MEINIVTNNDLERIKSEILEGVKTLLNQHKGVQKDVLKSADVRKMLGISPGTLQNLRINGTLPYSKVGGTIYYQMADVIAVINSSKKVSPIVNNLIIKNNG